MTGLFESESSNKFFQYFGFVFFVYFLIKYVFKIANNISTFKFGGIDFKKHGDWASVFYSFYGIIYLISQLIHS